MRSQAVQRDAKVITQHFPNTKAEKEENDGTILRCSAYFIDT